MRHLGLVLSQVRREGWTDDGNDDVNKNLMSRKTSLSTNVNAPRKKRKLTKENVRFTFEDVFHEIVHVLGFNSTLYDLF